MKRMTQSACDDACFAFLRIRLATNNSWTVIKTTLLELLNQIIKHRLFFKRMRRRIAPSDIQR